MAVYVVTCPECRKILRSSKPVPTGKIVTCPKCEVMFAAPPAREDGVEVIEEVEVVDDGVEVVDDAVEVVEAVEEKPAKKPKGKKARESRDDEPRRKARPKKSGNGVGIAAAIGGLALLLLGGAGGLAYWLLGSGGGDEPLAYLPSDSQVIISADMKALMDTPIGPMMDTFLDAGMIPGLAKYKQDTGTTSKDLMDRMVMALRADGSKMTMAMKASQPLDSSKLAAAAGGTANKVSGQTIYKLAAAGGPTAMVQPSKKVALFSNIPDTELSQAAGGKSKVISGDLAKLAEKAGQGNQLWMLMTKDAMASGAAAAAQGGGVGGMLGGLAGGGADAAIMQAATGMAMWANLQGTDIDLTTAVSMPDAAQADKATESAKQSAAKSKGLAMQAVLLALPSGLRSLIQEMNDTAQYVTEGNLSLTKMRIKQSTLQSAIQSASALMPAAAAMPGGAAMPPGAAPGVQPPAPAPQPETPQPKRGPDSGGGGGSKGRKGGGSGKGKQ